eukprot:CAMPEP_0116825864 /NCGR_PEP_ID=MMETSP0418-20121206/2214_1 /TAXON_ID=1158023 /ORGANISM="Astrosyne radiata, Strain 13vi08-1A" /LENGTH=163 /DNA_ID=CAMNT_0004454443 /DNA_START=559 /DNA_END=1050 /DNA_ORIENTATION=+
MEGHAPAAGCMLALACHFRIMADNDAAIPPPPTIGLNESQFGFVAPPWLSELMIQTVGLRVAEKSLALGTLYTPKEALEIGLVDEVVPPDRVLDRAHETAAKWAKILPAARVASTLSCRKPLLEKTLAMREADTHHFCSFVTQESVQQHLTRYLEKLQKNKQG